ncbi:MAG TPA: NAD(P)H-hydrate dehydratase [Sedimentisphaerales bacterium]|nr:NAD(P)H-hydrate dehydratase [Sedimentisphaerales bacterium]
MQLIETIPKLKPRPVEAHKGDFGKVLIVAGSLGMSGAAALAGRSALRGGAGLVRVAIPRSILPIVASIEPSYTTIPLPEDDAGRISAQATAQILNAAADNDATAFGPGIGTSTDLRIIVERLIEQDGLNLIIDADGLNNLAALGDWPDKLKANLILTPHPGEMKRLWHPLIREPLPAARQDQAVKFARRAKAVIVLKGAGTVVTDGERVYTNKTGNPGMATAGAGDVLTGIITALVAQGLGSLEAAILAVYVHGRAGDMAAKTLTQTSLIATDIINHLPQVWPD